MAESNADKLRKAEEARDAAVAEANVKFGEAAAEFGELTDPSRLHASNAVQSGTGMGDEYEEAKSSKKSAKAEEKSEAKAESVKDIEGRIADMDEDELAALEADERKGVQDALAAERERRAAAAESE